MCSIDSVSKVECPSSTTTGGCDVTSACATQLDLRLWPALLTIGRKETDKNRKQVFRVTYNVAEEVRVRQLHMIAYVRATRCIQVEGRSRGLLNELVARPV